ncbi:SIN3 component of histone deacetylase complex isoform C [Chlorella sorokiniana]|uniref:SIN3 component of histone deacetylase complex isoform C n=1 Tax=Chlorella sorokiniana TaxID=3076 RepID=A0A2P6TFP0_CHLSO|nr:SIN3 component of histone deacetylase complex isoform C [Chlorella sorokiniana]|eukprot:PRW32936.1 SIN3 component of histone deacetylase complex isoform C [Chlorella sorokiniana]
MKRTREGDGPQPPGKRPAGGEEERRERLTTNDALSYLREVKTRFANNRKVYDSFLEIMKQFKAQTIDTTGVIDKVKDLFKGHPELILGFNTFLPKGYEIRMDDLAPNVQSWQPPSVKQPPAAAAASKPPVEFDQAITYVNKIKMRFQNDERVYKAFLEILNMYRKGQKTIANVYEEVALLFRNHDDLLREFTYFLPDNTPPLGAGRGGRGAIPKKVPGGYKAGRKAPPPLRKDDPKVARELQFFERVKQRLRNKEAYADFLKCLNMFAEDILAKQELVSLVHDIIGKHSDLMAMFNEFLMRCEVGPDDPYTRQYPRDRNRNNTVEKYIRMSISELDVSTWQRCSPSYVLLPSNYPKLKASGRTPLGLTIFNDDWVSVTSGSEDYSFKHYRKNQYEEALFRAEDDHFELDMIIDQNASAIKALRPLAAQLEAMSEEEKAGWQLPEKALRAFHFRAVQRIYGEQGAQVVALLRQNPAVAVPTVLNRLTQKDSEWRQTKAEMMQTWQQIFKENYHKSLDHRSFYFKQAEKKNLTPKGMLADLKEAAEKRKQERSLVLQAVSGRADFSARLQAHMTFPCTDVEAHKDACYVVQLGINNNLSGEHAPKVRALFHAFIEAFFQLPCSCEAAEERRRAQPVRTTDAPMVRRGRRPKAAASEPNSMEAGGADGMDVDGGEETAGEGGVRPKAARAKDQETNTEAESTDDDEEPGVTSHEPSAFTEEDEDESAFVNCRPLVPLVPAASSQQQQQGGEAPAAAAVQPGERGHCGIFYGNESLFVLLRLYQYVYERMAAARSCALQKASHVSFSTLGGDTQPVPEWTEAAGTVHTQFLDLATSLIEGRVDASNYEDETRALLGMSSYVLFTLDKLVQKVVKQVQLVLQEEQSHRLVELWRYEAARGVPVVDAVYHANAHVLLQGDTCFRWERLPDGKLSVQLMDADKMDAPPGILDPAFHEYVTRFIDSSSAPAAAAAPPAEEGEEAGSKVCLQRNLPASDKLSAAAESLYDGVQMVNGLECKLCNMQQKIKKIAYVLGTEDFFHRRRKAKASADKAARSSKFAAFIAKHAAPAAPAAPAAAAPVAVA